MPKAIPLSEMTRQQLRVRYNNLIDARKPIPDDLNARLAEVFSRYNPKKRVFMGMVIVPVSQMTVKQARRKYERLREKGKAIPDELNEHLGKICPTYDPIKRDFIGKAGRIIPISKMTPQQLKNKFFALHTKKEPIPDNLNKRLAQAHLTYDPVQRKFLGTRSERRRAAILPTLSKKQLNNRYRYAKRNDQEIRDDLNEMLAKKNSRYDPITQTYSRFIPTNKLTRDQAFDRFKKLKLAKKPIPNDLSERLAAYYPTYDKQWQDFMGRTVIYIKTPNVNTIRTKKHYISINDTNLIDGIQYANICLDDRQVIKNAPQPTAHAVMGDLVLAVHTVETEHYPAQYRLFDARLRPIKSTYIIKHVSATDDELHIYTDSGAMITISKQKLLENINNAKQFVIKGPKHR